MTKRSLFNSCLCACIGIAAFGVVVLARSSSIERTVCCFPLLEMEALFVVDYDDGDTHFFIYVGIRTIYDTVSDTTLL